MESEVPFYPDTTEIPAQEMGACASKFSVLRSSGDATPSEDVASRDLNLAEPLMVQKDVKTPAPADDEPKRQMLANLFKESEGDASTTGNNGNESAEIKQEYKPKEKHQENENIISAQSDSNVAVKVEKPRLENKGLGEEKNGQDVEPASQYVETEASSQNVAEEELVKTAPKVDASGDVENQGTIKLDEINKPLENSDSNKELEALCLEKGVEEKAAVVKGAEEKTKAEMTKEVEMLEAEKLGSFLEREIEKEQIEATEVELPEMEINDGQKALEGTQDEPTVTINLEVPEGEKPEDQHKPDSEIKEKSTEEKSAEPIERDIEEKIPERRETEEQTEVQKPASDAEKERPAGKLLCPGTTKIDTDAEKKTEDDQPSTGGTTLEKEDKQEQAVEPLKTEQTGLGDKLEEKSASS